MESSLLTKLSYELRNKIYLAYFMHNTIEIEIDGRRPVVKNHVLALPKTCRQIYNESMEVFKSVKPSGTYRIMTNALPHIRFPGEVIGSGMGGATLTH